MLLLFNLFGPLISTIIPTSIQLFLNWCNAYAERKPNGEAEPSNLPKPRQDLESATDGAWAVAGERERLIAKLAAEKHVRVQHADAAADALDLTRMIYRLVARYRRDPRMSSLFS